MTTTARHIMIVAGEASGDLHGANLINAARDIAPETRFFGVGGHRMAAAGCEILIPSESLAVMGIFEVAGHIPVLWRSFCLLKRALSGRDKPEALILIDFPDFNLRLAKHAKKSAVPVLFYVSPQVWAWRRRRVKKIARVVDSLAAILPFEPACYQGQDVLVKYVGHPLLDEFAAAVSRNGLQQRLPVPSQKRVVGLFPGSRRNELHHMLGTLVEAAELILVHQPDTHFLVPVADTLRKEDVQSKFPQGFPVSFIESRQATIYEVASSCETVLAVSGTVTLQVALAGTPMAIFYKLSPLTYAIGKYLVNVEHFGLPNIVVGERIVPEYLQAMATPQALADEALRVLNDADYAESLRIKLRMMRTRLGEPGCAKRVAGMLFDMLDSRQQN